MAAPQAVDWLNASEYLASEERREAETFLNFHFAVEFRTSGSAPVFEAGWGTANGLSPDGTMMAASNRFTTRIVDRAGGMVLDGVPGEFHTWSADGRFILTNSFSSSCGPALVVTRISSGQQVACSPAGPSSGGTFSPDSVHVAFTQSRWLVTPAPGSATPVTNDLVITDLATGATRTVATDMRGHLRCLTWSASSRYVVVGVCSGV
jgi:hypothetical protein